MSNSPLHVVACLTAYPDKVEPLKSLLLSLLAPTRQEAGCIQYDLLQNRSEPTEFTFVEQWESEAALEAHLASRHLQAAFPQLEGLVAAGPDIRRYTPLNSNPS